MMNAWFLACWMATAASPVGFTPTVLAQTDAGTSAKTSASKKTTANKKKAHSKRAATSATLPAASAQKAPVADTGKGQAAEVKSAQKPAAFVMAPEVRTLVDRVQKFYEDTRDFEAGFSQRYTYAASHRTQVSTGTVKFKKPGLMRWDYLTPTKRTFLLTGDRAYALDPEALTLTKSPVDENQLSAAVTFLFGKGKLADEFDITRQDCKSCKGTQLLLTPKRPDPRFQRILLEVDPSTAQVLKSTVIDPDDSVNEITFENLKTNAGLTDEQFKLTPPPNTQIIDLTKPR